MISSQTILYALAGGILPALVWLWFWLGEDKLHPEPRKVIIATFIGGMIAVPLVIPFQSLLQTYFGSGSLSVMFVLWVIVEEFFKFLAAYTFGIRLRDDDEPIDPIVYMITAAIGFAAAENALYLFTPLSADNFLGGLAVGNLRFMGSSLLHIVSSAAIGIALGFAFYKSRRMKILFGFTGFLVAVVLHSLFNLLILHSDGTTAFSVFYGVWVVILALLLFFEKLKKIEG